MKILYITKGDNPDYMNDLILHGLYFLFGEDLTHTGDCRYMYSEFTFGGALSALYGRGFTVFGTLPKYINDNSDIVQKIKNKYFDYIIYGSIYRDQSYLDIVLSNYSNNKIVFIDGEDHSNILNLNDNIIYFKRELYGKKKNVLPISFSIPEEKIVKDVTNIIKIKKDSNVKPNPTPGYHKSFIYDNEKDYYKDYQESYFGLTTKKGGWDCLRHYEILSNYCVPFFPDIEKCPENIMVNFPKDIIKKTNEIYSNITTDEYYELLDYLFNYTKTNLTTINSVKYILDILKNNN